MVTPPALMAATPVGATITIRLLHVFWICFKKVVLPVPALPVKNKLILVFFTKSLARLKVILSLSVVSTALIYGNNNEKKKKKIEILLNYLASKIHASGFSDSLILLNSKVLSLRLENLL